MGGEEVVVEGGLVSNNAQKQDEKPCDPADEMRAISGNKQDAEARR